MEKKEIRYVPLYVKYTYEVTTSSHSGYCSDPYDIKEDPTYREIEIEENENNWTLEDITDLDVSDYDTKGYRCCASIFYSRTCLKIEPCKKSGAVLTDTVSDEVCECHKRFYREVEI
jgi:hypothetical protein